MLYETDIIDIINIGFCQAFGGELMTTIKDARKKLGITQEQMADYLGIGRTTYAKYELEPGLMTVRQAKKICAALEIKAAEFFLLIADT